MIRVTIAALAVAAGILAIGVADALDEPLVYDAPRFYSVTRFVAQDGGERIRLDATVHKLMNCDVVGPPWADFYDADGAVPPPGAIFRGDGTPAGHTRGNGGDTYRLDGYTITMPAGMSGRVGTMIARIPCRLWTATPGGGRVWGRSVVAEYGPLPVPALGGTASDHVVLAGPGR